MFTQKQLVKMLIERIEWQSELLGCKVTEVNKLMGGWGYSTNAEYYTIQKIMKWTTTKKLNTLSSEELENAIYWLDQVRYKKLNII